MKDLSISSCLRKNIVKQLFILLLLFSFSNCKIVAIPDLPKSWQYVGSPNGISTGIAYDLSLAIDNNNVPFITYIDSWDMGGAIVVQKYY